MQHYPCNSGLPADGRQVRRNVLSLQNKFRSSKEQELAYTFTLEFLSFSRDITEQIYRIVQEEISIHYNIFINTFKKKILSPAG